MGHSERNYEYYKEILGKQPMPFAFVDLDLLEENAKNIALRTGEKKVRIASKSIRCISILNKIFQLPFPFQGIMCYSLPEAVYLSQNGFDDILMGYPCMQEKYIEQVCGEISIGKKITLMVDCAEHVKKANEAGIKYKVIVPLCIDLDMSTSFPLLHFGVNRSPLNKKDKVLSLVEEILKFKNVRLEGLMGYEAQIAGVGDNYPAQKIKNKMVKFLKKKSIKEIAIRREEVVRGIEEKGIKLRFVNGGGTGSLESTRQEKCVTETTAGSGFYSSALFDNYSNFKHLPAAGFAIEVVRKPKENIYTCHGGGYIASGSVGNDKEPLPYLPPGLKLNQNEGAGEVQTPLISDASFSSNLRIGDPVFMRHSKAGELCERFNSLLLLSNGKILSEVKTYRGDGMCFL